MTLPIYMHSYVRMSGLMLRQEWAVRNSYGSDRIEHTYHILIYIICRCIYNQYTYTLSSLVVTGHVSTPVI